MKREIIKLQHKITVEQILALLQGKELRVVSDQIDIRLYPPQDVLTFSREEIEQIRRDASRETLEKIARKEDLRFIDFLPSISNLK